VAEVVTEVTLNKKPHLADKKHKEVAMVAVAEDLVLTTAAITLVLLLKEVALDIPVLVLVEETLHKAAGPAVEAEEQAVEEETLLEELRLVKVVQDVNTQYLDLQTSMLLVAADVDKAVDLRAVEQTALVAKA